MGVSCDIGEFKEKQGIADTFIEKTDPYGPLIHLEFDLRGYSDYVKKNGIHAGDVTEETMQMFIK